MDTKDKQKASGAYPLFARITVDGVASRFNTKLDVLPEMWNGKAGKAIGRTAEAGRINRMLSDINASLNAIYHEMQQRDNNFQISITIRLIYLLNPQ